MTPTRFINVNGLTFVRCKQKELIIGKELAEGTDELFEQEKLDNTLNICPKSRPTDT